MAVRIDKTNGKFLSRTTFGGASEGWTVMGWVYAVSAPSSGAYYGVIYRERTSNQDACEFVNNGGNLKLTLWDGVTETQSATLSTATWYHVAIVRETASVFKLYINGALDHTGGTNSQAAKNGIMRIGVWATSTDVSDCRFAAFKIWDAALTLAEVAQEMQTIAPRRYASLIGFLPMFPGSGERARDYSGLGNDYTENGTLTDETPPPVGWGGQSLFLPFVAAGGGGTQYTQDTDGTLTSSGLLVNQANKFTIGTLTSTGAIVKQTSKTPAGTLTSSGALSKQAQKATAGTLTSAGALVKQAQKVVSGTLSSAGVLTKAIAATVVGTLTSAGSLVKQTSKALAGTLTSSGVLVPTKVALLALSGTLSSAGALVKQSGKVAAGTLSSAGALVKQTGKNLAGALSSAGDLAAQKLGAFAIDLAGTLSSSGALVKQTGKAAAGTLTSAGSLVKQAGKNLTGTLSSAGAIVTNKIMVKALAGTLSSSGAIVKQAQKGLAGALSSAGALAKRISTSLSGLLQSSGFLGTAGGMVPPVSPTSFQGEAHYYDDPSRDIGTIAGGTVIAGPTQTSATGVIDGGTVQPGPTQDSPTGTISGGTTLPPETQL